MKFAVVVHSAPNSSQGCLSALKFTEALLNEGHEILRVFFYHDGVYTANKLIAAPQDEPDVAAMWQSLAESNDLELVACISSCLRRGIVDETEASRYEKKANNLRDGFTISGLGQLIDAVLSSDRLVTFGD